MRVILGTYTDSRFVKGQPNTGIRIAELDSQSGKLSRTGALSHPGNPSFLGFDNKKHLLFAVAESQTFGQEPGGGLVSFKLSTKGADGRLSDSVTTEGSFPCHISVHPDRPYVVVTNYGGGNVALFEYNSEGRLHLRNLVRHEGSSVHSERQEAPHPHSSLWHPNGQLLFVADLGIDRVLTYHLDREKKQLVPAASGTVPLPPGSGPRHMAFHCELAIIYIFNELTGTITAARMEQAGPTAVELITIPTLPTDYTGEPSGAEIALHPNGRFLVVSNRGHNSLSVFALASASGQLELVGHFPTGPTPRHFAISPDGRWLVCGHQDADSVDVWSFDVDSGRLQPTGHKLREPAVVCVQFL